MVDLALVVEQVIDAKKVRDWVTNNDVQDQMKNEIEDCLYRFEDETGVSIPKGSLDIIIDKMMSIAIQRDAL